MQFQRLSPCGAPGLQVLRRIAPRGARSAAASLQLATRRRIRQTLVLSAPLVALLAAVLLAAACGGGDAPPASGTPSAERAEREQTVAQQTTATQQQAQAEAEESTASQAAEQPDPQPETVAQQQQQQQQEFQAAIPDPAPVDAEVEDESQQTITFDDQLVERIAAGLAAHRAGLPTARNALGDPAAPVLIVEYGDFQ